MGTIIRAVGVHAEDHATEYLSPVNRGIQGIFFLNTSLEKACHNYAPGKPNGSIVGTPPVDGTHLSAKSQANFVQTEVAESDELTIFCIGRTSDAGTNPANRPAFYGTYRNLSAAAPVQNPGVSVWRDNASMRANAAYSDDPGAPVQRQVILSSSDFSSWSLYVHRVSASGVYFADMTKALSGTVAAIGARQRSVGKFRIGGVYYEFLGSCDVAVWQAHSVALTDQEIGEVVQNLRTYGASRGIVV